MSLQDPTIGDAWSSIIRTLIKTCTIVEKGLDLGDSSLELVGKTIKMCDLELESFNAEQMLHIDKSAHKRSLRRLEMEAEIASL